MEAGSNADRTFWRFPWGYRHAGVLTVTLVSVGLVMQAVAPGASQRLPGWPWNSVLLLVFTGAVAVVRLIWLSRRSPVIRWLGSASVGVSALSALGLLGGLAAVIPQGEGHEFSGVWLHQIVGSWPLHLRLFCCC